jgi:hypothetical protein
LGKGHTLFCSWRLQNGSLTTILHPRCVVPFLSFLMALFMVSTSASATGAFSSLSESRATDFYVPHLDAFYNEANSLVLPFVTIFAYAYWACTPPRHLFQYPACTCAGNVQAHLQFLDKLLIAFGPKKSVLLMRYSIDSPSCLWLPTCI